MKVLKTLFLFFVLFILSFSFLNVKAIQYSSSENIEMLSAELRLEEKEGIRFTAHVSDFDLTNVSAYGIEIAYGYAHANQKFVLGSKINGKEVLNGEVQSTNNGYYYVTLYAIPEDEYCAMVSARAYVVKGEEVIYSENVITKNIANLVTYAESSNAFVSNAQAKVKDLYSDVKVSFDYYGITKEKYEFWLETYYNGIDLSYSNYIASKEAIINQVDQIPTNSLLLKYSTEHDAYQIVSVGYAQGLIWDYAIINLEESVIEKVEIGQYLKFDAELSEGMAVFNAYAYEKNVIPFLSETIKYPTVLPTITKDGLENYAWISSIDGEVVNVYPGYDSSVTEVIYSPVWNQAVFVTFDHGGNIAYSNKEELVKDFIKDFNAYNSLSCASDGSDFYDKSSSKTFEFFDSISYQNKWSWLLEYVNQVRAKNSKNNIESENQEIELTAEIHNFLNSSFTHNIACDYTSEDIANGYKNLDCFKKEEVEYLFETKLPVLKREGYVFEGWKSSLDNEIHDTFIGYEEKDKTITYTAVWSYSGSFEYVMDNVSDIATSSSTDTLPSEIDGNTIVWESSNPDLYEIKDGKGFINRQYQSHKNQFVTITAKISDGNQTFVCSKEVNVYPVVFDDMTNPKAVYFALGSASNYTNNSERYKTEGTLFSETFKNNMDMVYYAFAYTGNDGSISLNDAYLEEVMELRNYGIRVLLVLDGQGTSLKALTVLSDDDEKRQAYVDRVMDMVEKYNFDGVDIDWEYPGVSGLDSSYYSTERDQMNLNKLLRDFRNEMTARQGLYGSPYILSAAIPATSWGSQRYDFSGTASKKLAKDPTLGGIDDYCDYVNMMSYDLNKETNATHLTACYTSKTSTDYKFSCQYGVNRFVALGLSKEKIILGAAAYGKAYLVSGNVNMSSSTPALGMSAHLTIVDGVTGSFASGTIYYSGITELMKTGKYTEYTEYNNGKVVGSYLYSNETKIYVSFDSVTSIKAKCEYAKQNGFGMMVWAYGEDSTDTIVNTICENLK